MSELILLIVLLLLSAFFAAVEAATLSVSKVKLRSLLEQKRKGAAVLYSIKQNPNRLLITILIGNNLVNIAAASVATAASIKLFGDTGVGIATGVMTLLILVFGDITPKTFAIQNAESLALLFARPIQILEFVLWPAVTIFEAIARFVNSLSGEKSTRLTEEELRSIITLGREEGLLDTEATKRLQSVLDFETTTVAQIMTPKAEIISFDAGLTIEQFLDNPLDAPFDRYPLYEGSEDKIVGILDLIDVVRAMKEEKISTKLKEIMRPTFFVKSDARLDTLLSEFRPKRASMGIVIIEHGKMVGVFTSQDIVEEIVGDIFEDELYKNTNG
ncbi:MAG TPA: CNNM domain-containing protein [Candidatus Nanoarchaeia archaeon]